MMDNNIKLIYVDLFCGFGGTTYGVEESRDENGNKIAKVIACVNHDKNAINSHYLNHPDTKHYTEDIRTLNLIELLSVVKQAKARYYNAKLVLWASLECTHFSKARGGKPKDADSRTLADHLFRYIFALNPDFIMIENVREFRTWGPLDEFGKPIKELKGWLYDWWKNKVKSLGFNLIEGILNSADYGGCQTRRRLFMVFSKIEDLSFPLPTHSKEEWKPVKDVLDLDKPGKSIFTRKKPLANATLERILAGLNKYVANGEPDFIQQYYGGKPKVKSISQPAGTITTKDHHGLVQCDFLVEYYGKGKPRSIKEPIGTLTTKGRHSLVSVNHFIDKQYSGKHNHSSINSPAGSLTTVNKQNLVRVEKQFLMNPQFKSKGRDVDDPCFTLISRMDKAPPYLVTVESGETKVEPIDRITSFMGKHGISDIKTRMLNLEELLQIQGFPRDYKMVGTKAEKCKYIGNAVHTLVSKAICEQICKSIKHG